LTGDDAVNSSISALALVGMPGAGKSLCAAHLQRRGYYQFRFGQIVVDEVARRGWALTPENERIVREQFRAEEGMDAIARRALPHLQAALTQHRTIVMDGLYSFSEYKMLRQVFGDQMVLIAIVCERALRYARLAARPERPLTAAEAERRDHQEIEKLEKGGSIAIADFTLLNNGEPEALITALDTLIVRLGVEP
jgi:dephospho-CoA kinase